MTMTDASAPSAPASNQANNPQLLAAQPQRRLVGPRAPLSSAAVALALAAGCARLRSRDRRVPPFAVLCRVLLCDRRAAARIGRCGSPRAGSAPARSARCSRSANGSRWRPTRSSACSRTARGDRRRFMAVLGRDHGRGLSAVPAGARLRRPAAAERWSRRRAPRRCCRSAIRWRSRPVRAAARLRAGAALGHDRLHPDDARRRPHPVGAQRRFRALSAARRPPRSRR